MSISTENNNRNFRAIKKRWFTFSNISTAVLVYVPASEIPQEYFSGSMPTTVILDKTGAIAFHHLGGADYETPEVSAFIDKLSK